MLKKTRLLWVLGLAGLVLLSGARAQAFFSPLGVSLIPPVEFPPEEFSITGARASVIWGKHRGMYGLDLGLIGNVTEQNFVGLGVAGVFNMTSGEATVLGFQLAGIANVNSTKANIFGLQLAGAVNSNLGEATLVGVQVALLSNYSPYTHVYGVQVGLYNKAREVHGFQIGLCNVTENLHGIQLGLVNFNTHGLFAIAPILNIGF